MESQTVVHSLAFVLESWLEIVLMDRHREHLESPAL